MNITSTNSTAVTKVRENLIIKYRMSTRGTEAVKDITAEIINNETVVGYFNMSKNGIVGFSLHEGSNLSQDEIKHIFQQAIDDSFGVLS
ncbi:hypothetical protein [Bacteroides sp. AM10-21B]|uniref:hypothetical protein n=1 Tax=Bacteroides sp. AM10-21B TaxID=2292001 RepID=UPI000E4F7A87|nr:hypothetical protein [Bacteroides sp. AM10-21B]RHJ51085.1 hypothetical protein DW121_08860 [Bacteroides sp. AM10-21B]